MKKYFAYALSTLVFLISCQPDLELKEKPLPEDLKVFHKETTQDLGLNARQSKGLTEALNQEADQKNHPGFLWLVARHLQENLPAAEKENLLNTIDTIEKHLVAHGVCIPLGFELNFSHPLHPHPGLVAQVLTAEQHPVFKNLVTAHHQHAEELVRARKEGKLSPQEFQLRMQQNFHMLMSKLIGGLLTDEQRIKLGHMLQQQAKQREEFIRQSFHVMAVVLDLKPEQLHKIVSISVEVEKHKAALIEKMKSGDLSEEALRSILQQTCSHVYSAMESMLNAKQLEVVKIYRALSFRPRMQMKDSNG